MTESDRAELVTQGWEQPAHPSAENTAVAPENTTEITAQLRTCRQRNVRAMPIRRLNDPDGLANGCVAERWAQTDTRLNLPSVLETAFPI
jgi:hypothetical protein